MKATRTVRTPLIVVSVAVSAAVLVMLALAERSADTADTRAPALTAAEDDQSLRLSAAARTQAAAPASSLPAIAALRQEAYGEVLITEDRSTTSKSVVRVAYGGDLHPLARNGIAPADKVAAFLARHGAVFGIENAARQLKLLDTRKDQYGSTRVSYQQMHEGVPVFAAILRGHVAEDGRLTAVNGKFVPQVDVPTRPRIEREAASKAATTTVGGQQPSARKDVDLTVKSAALMVYRTNLTRGAPGENRLVYEIQVSDDHSVREFVYVDAQTGKVVDQVTGIHGLKKRRVYEAKFDPNNPGVPPPLWREGDLRPAIDPAHEDEVASTGQSYNLFFNLSGGTRRSWDGADAWMITVNNDPTIVCPNANWNGTSTNYCSGTSADDVVAHEWTHAYTQETSGLIYQWQSGALNESYSDIFGETVDQINNREGVEGTAAAGNDGPRSQNDAVCSEFASELPTGDDSLRWLMGEDAFAFSPLPPIGDAAIRDMWRPRCAGGLLFFGDPGHVDSPRYSCSAGDAGGVHTNSGVNNRAYALLADGDTVELKDDGTPFASPVTVRGIGLTKAAHIFWRANSVYNGPASNFADNADSLVMACTDLVGRNLTKLVTSREDGAGLMGINDDTVDPTPELSGQVVTPEDCEQVANAIAAVEMRFDVTEKCNFGPLLDPAPAPMCGTGTANGYFTQNWESGTSEGWTVGQTPVSKTVLDTRPWFLRSGDLPANPDGSPRPGSAMFQENRRDLGNCSTDDESGVLFLESPPITVDANSAGHLVFAHYMATEVGYDGGNVMISINGGEYSVIPSSAFVHNPYTGNLNDVIDQNTNPKAGEEAWHGGNENEVSGDWGQSQIDLAAAGVQPGDSVQLRWDFGQDGCNGSEGWYVDDIELFTCEAVPPAEVCNPYPATMPTPLGSPIVSLAGSTTTANVTGETAPVTDLNICNLRGSHTYMGDLTFRLKSPSGTSVMLFDGSACASEDGIDVQFDDGAASVIGCNDWLSGGTFRAQQALSAFNGQNANGDWTLTITDGFLQDDGLLESWAVEMCTLLNRPPVANNDTAKVKGRQTVTLHVLANDSDPDGDCLRITHISQPTQGTATLVAGSCEPTNKDSISYRPNGRIRGTDTFTYDVSDGKGGTGRATVTIGR
ncbi:MAG: M4 family metallopeptidase [Gammaproteobacteria bacterium]